MEKKILVTDDSLFFREQMARILSTAGYAVLQADSGEKALDFVQLEKPDLVLLDVVMPDMDGFEICRILRDSESNNLMPIIMLTSKDDQEDKLVGLELGADDYITKPFNERELLSRIRNTLRRIDRNRAVNPLTGLQGNLEIQREIDSRIARGNAFAVVYSDLDNFKAYNDAYGFAKGDMAIILTADILRDQVRLFGNPDDFIGHIGGDDFTIITTPDKAEKICMETIAQFDEKIRLLYTRGDVEQGFISSVNRKGETERYPITSITMAIVDNVHNQFHNHLEVSHVATELKRYIKRKAGSNFLSDRRRRKQQALEQQAN